jgi:septum formation protein
MDFNKSLLLASKSPRRQELIKSLGYPFSICEIDVEEIYPENLKGAEVAEFLSHLKASAYSLPLTDNQVVISADTIVCLDDEILGKPKNTIEASEMLNQLSGRSHKVITGVTLMSSNDVLTFSEETKVTFKDLSQTEIDYYISHYKPFDKAGSYGIQEWIGHIGITKMEGSYFNVVGLPIQKIYQNLQSL